MSSALNVATGSDSPARHAVEVEGLSVRRGGRRVLDDLTLSISRGSLAGLIGPSGSGKTTLMRAIVGTQSAVSGRVAVLGHDAGDRALRRRVGYVTQAPSVYSDLPVIRNLRYFARILGAPADDAERVLELVGMTVHARSRVDSLSGGELNRVSLAVGLLGRPELLVLDEPTVGLDPVLRERLWRLFHELADAGTTLLVSSHVMDEAMRCDRLLLLRDGRLVADTTPDALLRDTATTDPENAFLTLIAQGDAASSSLAGGDAR